MSKREVSFKKYYYTGPKSRKVVEKVITNGIA